MTSKTLGCHGTEPGDPVTHDREQPTCPVLCQAALCHFAQHGLKRHPQSGSQTPPLVFFFMAIDPLSWHCSQLVNWGQWAHSMPVCQFNTVCLPMR